jgi:DNA-binding CsgD family transcriptional regulator/tetratricopeptide (TPR) repeat protein
MTSWKETYDRLRKLDDETPLEPARLIELAAAAYLVGLDSESRAVLVRAHHGFVQAHDLRRAGGIAAQLALIFMTRGDIAQASGWMARAGRLLDESDDCRAERGHLLVAAARQSLISGNLADAEQKFAEAARLGEQCGDADVMNLARQGHGRVLIERGELERGIALLDEVMVAVTAGEVSTVLAGIIYCSVLSACSDIFDLGRAREWTEALTRWCDAQPDMVPYRGECLVHRAEVIGLGGLWTNALQAALLACERLSEPPGQPAFGSALYQLGELHRLRGNFDAAEDAYRKSAEAGRSPYPGLALLRLAQHRGAAAAAAICRVLQESRQRRTRARVLAAAVEIMVATEDVAAARGFSDELSALARSVGTPFLRASAGHALGAVLLAEGDPASALSACRSAWSLWRDHDVPYEAARVQVLIAAACRALGDSDAADIELAAACRTFDQLGALPDLDRVRRSSRVEAVPGGLTPREVEVLRLVATGRTNRSIADDLGLSEKTVARHLSNIFNKLDVSSRAAATAYAFEHQLVERST